MQTTDTLSDLYRRARAIREELEALVPEHVEHELLREATTAALNMESLVLIARERIEVAARATADPTGWRQFVERRHGS